MSRWDTVFAVLIVLMLAYAMHLFSTYLSGGLFTAVVLLASSLMFLVFWTAYYIISLIEKLEGKCYEKDTERD